jgi:hypothetical protein
VLSYLPEAKLPRDASERKAVDSTLDQCAVQPEPTILATHLDLADSGNMILVLSGLVC